MRALVWLRRDLRLDDHVALAAAAAACDDLACAFVIDPVQLAGDRVGPPGVQFFFESLAALRADLRAAGSDLAVLHGDAATELTAFAARIGADALFYNRDVEPPAQRRDRAVEEAFAAAGRSVESFTDQVYFAADEVLKPGGEPYTVFTPYKRRWLERHAAEPRPPLPSAARSRKLLGRAAIGPTLDVPSPEDLGFSSSVRYPKGGAREARRILDAFAADRIANYDRDRNAPAHDGTSRLSPHLRAGTIGIRTCVFAALEAGAGASRGAETWLSELIWREFYSQILAHFPHVAERAFVPAAERIAWLDDGAGFAAWCEGRTGYPIVDAAMKQLTSTGWMHNRLRMIAASFLTKDLLIDWRRGERFFERWLADADLASNNGGWQWAASTGTDAAPYFRIFNPLLQSKKFDPGGSFIAAMLPELQHLPPVWRHEPHNAPPLVLAEAGVRLGETYPWPIVEHQAARERALSVFAAALGAKSQ